MDQTSEKEDCALALVEDREFLPTDPENPSTSLPHEESTIGYARPKLTIKPTLKRLENRFHSDKEKQEKMCVEMALTISKLRKTPDAVEKIRSAISQLHPIFREYQLVWVFLMILQATLILPNVKGIIKP